jgi:hypothetical protein
MQYIEMHDRNMIGNCGVAGEFRLPSPAAPALTSPDAVRSVLRSARRDGNGCLPAISTLPLDRISERLS